MSSMSFDKEWEREQSVRLSKKALPVSREIILAAQIFTAKRRTLLASFQDQSLFENPALDMMLGITIDESAGRNTSVSAACISANVAATTALRWINKLEHAGILLREDDPEDRRRSWVRLTPDAKARFEKLLLAG